MSRGLTKPSFFANSSYENLIFQSPVLSRHQSAMTFFVGLSSSLPPLPTPSNQIRTDTDLKAGVRFKDPLPLPSKQRRLITAMKGPPRRGIIGVMAPPMNPFRGTCLQNLYTGCPHVSKRTPYTEAECIISYLVDCNGLCNTGGATSGAVFPDLLGSAKFHSPEASLEPKKKGTEYFSA